jgi:hypothetical protein
VEADTHLPDELALDSLDPFGAIHDQSLARVECFQPAEESTEYSPMKVIPILDESAPQLPLLNDAISSGQQESNEPQMLPISTPPDSMPYSSNCHDDVATNGIFTSLVSCFFLIIRNSRP